MIVSRHAVFLKIEFVQDGGSRRKIELEEKVSKERRVQESEPNNEPVNLVPPPPHRSNKVFHPLKRYLGILTKDLEEVFLMGDRDIRNDPKTYDKTMLDIDFEKWMEAMKSEIDCIYSNQIWSLEIHLKVMYLLGVNRFIKEKLDRMVRKRSIRQG